MTQSMCLSLLDSSLSPFSSSFVSSESPAMGFSRLLSWLSFLRPTFLWWIPNAVRVGPCSLSHVEYATVYTCLGVRLSRKIPRYRCGPIACLQLKIILRTPYVHLTAYHCDRIAEPATHRGGAMVISPISTLWSNSVNIFNVLIPLTTLPKQTSCW